MKRLAVFVSMILIVFLTPTKVDATLMADLDANPTNGVAPLLVSFDLGYFYQPSNFDLDVEKYELDFEGDGTYDWVSTLTGTTSYTYTYPGIFEAIGRVTNTAGHTAVDSEWITVRETSVPEPTTLSLMGLGLAGIGFARKRMAA